MSLPGVMTPASVLVMTPDRLTLTAQLITETVDTLQALDIPADRIHSLNVQHWSSGTVVQIHIEGDPETAVPLADRIADHYGLPAADDEDRNYTRGGHLGITPVSVYCARPDKAS